jgi:hypothetical protein
VNEENSLRKKLETDYAQREEALTRLIAPLEADYAFGYLMQQVRIGDSAGVDHDSLPALVEFAAFHLYPRIGQGGSQDPKEIDKVVSALKELNQRRAFRVMRLGERSEGEFSEAAAHARISNEFVRGSAFPIQTRRQILELFAPFEAEMTALAEVSPARLVAVIDSFESLAQEQTDAGRAKYRAAMARLQEVSTRQGDGFVPKGDLEQFYAATQAVDAILHTSPWYFFVTFEAAQSPVPNLTEKEWEAFQSICGLTAGSRGTIREANEIRHRPVFFLPERGFTLLHLSAVFDAIFGAFDRMARSTPALRDRYGHHVAEWMEREAERFLLRLFPAAHVYRNLDYPDPDKPGGTAELDLAISWGGIFCPIEIKGRQFRIDAQRGDEKALKSDLRTNVAEAFWQARRVLRYLESVSEARLVERGTERTLELTRVRSKRCFPIVITLEHLGGLATQLATSGSAQWFGAGTYPWAVSLADFDVIAQFAGSPDVLLHYAQRRIQLQESQKDFSADELDMFAHYLDGRLHPSNYWARREEGREFSHIGINGGSERFEEWLKAKEDGIEPLPQIRLDVPQNFSAVLEMLRQSGDDDGRSIAISLLGLSPAATNRLEANITRLATVVMPPGKFPRTSFLEEDVAVVAMSNRGADPVAFRKHLLERTLREKYRLRAARAVGLAFDPAARTGGFVGATWFEFPWVHDETAERLLAGETSKFLARSGGKLPGRNDPCPCGSGRKFKQCCIDRVQFMTE